MPDILKVEVETFEQALPELLRSAQGKYVLVRQREVLGPYDTQRDAIQEGFRRFGNVPFLVRQVVASEVPMTFSSNLIGV